MKLLFENKKLILEFNKDDKEAILKDGERFTVAFEVELETKIQARWTSCDRVYLKDRLRVELPNFMSKYEDNLDFKEDESLKCGIEFTMDKPKYMIGLTNALKFLEVFFEDFKKQSYFFFTADTGFHVNIGYLDEEGELEGDYNLFKALTFLNHSHATSGMGFSSREGVVWAKDLKEPAIEDMKKFLKNLPKSLRDSGSKALSKDKLMDMYLERNFDNISKILSDQIRATAGKTWSKYQGFNIDNINDERYIEFRYPGNRDPNLVSMTKALMYYSFIVKAAVDPEFKKIDYESDLIGFFNEAMEEESSAVQSPFLKKFDKGMRFLELTKSRDVSIFSYFENALLSSIDWDKTIKKDRPNSNYWNHRARDILERIIHWGFGGVIDILENRTLVVYNGLSKGKVSLDRLVLNPSALSTRFGTSANMKHEVISPKEFQNRVDSEVGGNVYLMPIYSYNRGREQDLAKIEDIILNSSSALEISEKLYAIAIRSAMVPMGEYLRSFPLKGTDDSDYSKSDEEEIEDNEEEILEIKQYFKKYKF